MNRLIFGITGNLGAGKSTLSQLLIPIWKKHGQQLIVIEVDEVRRNALWNSTQIHHIQLRYDLAQLFSLTTESENHWINREIFTTMIFSNAENLKKYSALVTPIFHYDIKNIISSTQYDIAIVWTYLVEEKYDSLLNSSIVFINEQSFVSNEDNYLQNRISLQIHDIERLTSYQEKNIPYIHITDHSFFPTQLDSLRIELFSHYKNLNNMPQIIPMDNQQFSFCKFRIPKNSGRVIWEITNECNYGCKYCVFASTGRKPAGELTTQEIFKALEQLSSENFTHIKFTGGEPFLRDDMIDILKYAHHLGIHCDISTNASRITEEIAYELSLLPLEFIHVSLDGHDLTTHEAVRGKKSFWPTIKGIELLRKYGLKIRIGCVIHQFNEHKLFEMAQLSSVLEAEVLVFSLMEPIGRLRGKTTGLATLPITTLSKTINTIRLSYPHIKISHNLESFQSVSIKDIGKKPALINNTASCPGGKQFLFINSLGEVSPCTWVSENRQEYVGGKITQFSLKEILNSKPINDLTLISNYFALNKQAVCPMSNLDVTRDIEIAIQASKLSHHASKFGSFAPIYPFTTENLYYLEHFDIKEQDILTVGGSYDHNIDLILRGAKSVSNIDINYCAKYYANLKHTALLHFSYSTFIDFLGESLYTLQYDLFKQLEPYLDISTQVFFNELYKQFSYSGIEVANSFVFHQNNKVANMKSSLYLSNESYFNEVKSLIIHHKFNWYTQSIDNSELLEQFDLILLSNIADYSHIIYPHIEHIESYKEKVVLPWATKLKPHGKIMFAYIFDALNILHSDKRNMLNNSIVRFSHYNNLQSYIFSEYYFTSTIVEAKEDCVCILTRL